MYEAIFIPEGVEAIIEDCQIVTDIVQDTKAEIYPFYYPKEVVDFFANLHCYEHLVEKYNFDMPEE